MGGVMGRQKGSRNSPNLFKLTKYDVSLQRIRLEQALMISKVVYGEETNVSQLLRVLVEKFCLENPMDEIDINIS